MKFSCPETGVIFNIDKSDKNETAPKSYHFNNGVHSILSEELNKLLAEYIPAFEKYREPYLKSISSDDFRDLPYVNFDKATWKLRQYDLELVQSLMPAKRNKILEIGAWTGWLSHHLAKENDLLALDYFTHELDGLAAKKFYSEDWLTVQMDLENFSIIQEKFDLIVVNRACSYFTDLNRSLEQIKTLLKPNGKIVLLGICYYSNTVQAKQRLTDLQVDFEQKSGIPFFFKTYKGLIDSDELFVIKNASFEIKNYSQLRFKSFINKFRKNKPEYLYATWQKRC